MARLKERLLTTLCNAADVECPHRQLCTWFADGLRRDNADGLTLVNHRTAREVTAVAHGANAVFSFASQRAANTRTNNTRFLNRICHTLVDHRALRDDNFICAWLEDIVCCNTAQETLCQ